MRMLVKLNPRATSTSCGAENLCLKCSYYSRKKYALDDQETKICTVNGGRGEHLRGPVAECTDFYDKTETSLREMKEIAWVIEIKKANVGFGADMQVSLVPPKKKKDDE